jgi:disulfide oxidoreductase YuzD
LTQITEGNRNTAKGSVDFLNDTLKLYSNFSDLRRYLDIMKKKEQGSMTAEEKALMDRIGVREELKPFLPK